MLLWGWASGTGVAEAADRYDGVAYDRSGTVVFRETHWRYAEGSAHMRLVLYRCVDGRPFARKQMRWQEGNETSPDFDFLDQRDGYREGLASRAEGREVYWQANGGAAEKREQVSLGPDAVVDAGFDSFVRRHWDELVAGSPVKTVFLLPSDFDAIPVVIRLAPGQQTAKDSSAVTFSIALDRWYAFVAPTISVTYDRADRRLREFNGAATVRDGRGRRQVVRVEFPAEWRLVDAPVEDVATAATEPLVARCQDS